MKALDKLIATQILDRAIEFVPRFVPQHERTPIGGCAQQATAFLVAIRALVEAFYEQDKSK